MIRYLLVVAVALLIAPLRAAQDETADEEYTRRFQEGIEDLTAGRHDEGIAAFKRCLELRPEDATSAYNVACGHALKKELDPAFEWLAKSAELGFGNEPDNIVHAETRDPDLASLRGDPRFPPIIERMRELLAAVEKYAAEPAVYVPEALAEAEEVPLLVVLHDQGSSKDAVVSSPWKGVADELGLALIAPSGGVATGAGSEDGMAWFRSLQAYTDRYWTYEKSIQSAIDGFKKERKVDRKHIYIAGEGQGAMVAFNQAVRAPGQFKGVLIVNGPLHMQLAQSRIANAVKMGLRLRLLASTESMWGLGSGDIEPFLEGTDRTLKQVGFGAQYKRYTPDPEKPEMVHELVAAEMEALLGR